MVVVHFPKTVFIEMIFISTTSGIDSLFNKINCDRSAIDDMLGAQSGVTDSNMIQYLGIIEQRTNELLAVQSYVNSKVTYSPILIILLLIMIYIRQKSSKTTVWFSLL